MTLQSIIFRKYRMLIPSSTWGRLGRLKKRYGQDTVEKAIEYINNKPQNIHHLFNLIEIRCQQIINNTETVDIFKL